MKIISISDMKANAATLHEELGFETAFVTQNGRASLVVQTYEAYHLMQEKIAYLELIAKAKPWREVDNRKAYMEKRMRMEGLG